MVWLNCKEITTRPGLSGQATMWFPPKQDSTSSGSLQTTGHFTRLENNIYFVTCFTEKKFIEQITTYQDTGETGRQYRHSWIMDMIIVLQCDIHIKYMGLLFSFLHLESSVCSTSWICDWCFLLVLLECKRTTPSCLSLFPKIEG